MEGIKQKIKEIFKDKKLYLFTIVTFLFFGIYIILQYAPDTYFVFANGARATMSHFFSCGRFVTGLAAGFTMGLLRLGNEGVYFLSYTVAIICTIISIYKLYNLLRKEIKNDIVCCLTSIVVIINPFSFELFVYIEKGILMFSVLMCVIAVEQLNKFMQGNKKAIIWLLLAMLLANCSYQGTVGIFVAIGLIYIIKYSKNIKEFIFNNIIVALGYGIPAAVNFLLVKFLFANVRVEGEVILTESIGKILKGTKDMLIGTYEVLPKYIFSIIILVILTVIIVKAFQKEKSKKEKILKIAGAFYLLIGTIGVTVVPQILQNTDSIWFVARSSYPAGTILGILLIYLWTQFDISEKIKNVLLGIAIIVLGMQLISFTQYAIDGQKVNYQDQQNAKRIIEQITEYQEEKQIQVTKIALYSDKNPNFTYPEIKANGDVNIKAFCKEWAVQDLLKLYTKKDLKIVEKDRKIEEYFSQQDWNYYENEQVIIENDTIHLCNF